MCSDGGGRRRADHDGWCIEVVVRRESRVGVARAVVCQTKSEGVSKDCRVECRSYRGRCSEVQAALAMTFEKVRASQLDLRISFPSTTHVLHVILALLTSIGQSSRSSENLSTHYDGQTIRTKYYRRPATEACW